jgi:hypothetical protein
VRRSASELLETQGAVLDRRAVEELGFQRRSVDHIFQVLPVISLPGVRRAYIRADDFRRFLDENTYRGDRVRPE